MNYRVVWRRRLLIALDHTGFYARENGRDAVALVRAAAEIELRLSDEPSEEGESREGAERVLIIDPLSVIFEVFESSETVMIYEAVYHPRQRL